MTKATEALLFSKDKTTGAVNTVDYEHHEIHSGSHFFICGFETVDDTDSIDFAVTTPDSVKYLHMTFKVEGTSQTEFYIYEDATTSGGSATVPHNNNRNSSKTSDAVLAKNPTVSDAGDLIYSQSKGFAATTPASASGIGVVSREREIVLKRNSTTLFRITSADDGNIISYCGEWYEHSDKVIL